MFLLKGLKPEFWDHKTRADEPYKLMFNFRRIWKTAVLVMTVVALLPLVTMTLIDYNMTQEAIVTEILIRTSRFVSNTWRTISFFLTEHRLALDIIVQDNSYEDLNDSKRLADLRDNMQRWIGGCTDLGVIDAGGRQRTYVGPYPLEGKDYSEQDWFKEVLERGRYLSDVFYGFRNVPHLVAAVKQELPDGGFYVLRATLDTERFTQILSRLEIAEGGDAFIINRQGVLQTPSRFYGDVLDRLSIPVPEQSPRTRVYETELPDGDTVIVGYSYIPESPFIQMVIKRKDKVMEPWYRTRLRIIGFLIASISVILVAILGVATYLVNNMYDADQKRLFALHQVEYSNKMATIGRLAAGVSHEINNPLAVINEKAGLIKDLFTYNKDPSANPRLIGLIDSVLSSVERCGTITKRLLSFARHVDINIQPINLGEVIWDVFSFMNKEADYKSIRINLSVDESLPRIESDRGKLQQVFLNIINNAVDAMDQGGRLEISARPAGEDHVIVTVSDNGCGIPKKDIDHIFEPFFSTKTQKGGTGLGLSVTYSLIQQLGGSIKVESEVGKGTCFIITLPRKQPLKEGADHARTTGG